MKTPPHCSKPVLIFVLAASLALQAQEVAIPTWTTSDGRVLRAKFLRIDGKSLVIEQNGELAVVLLAKLSAESLAQARALEVKTAATSLAAEPDFGPQVLAFCRANMGRKVDNGGCGMLAVKALAAAGAARMGKDAPNEGDYVWGRQVALIEAGPAGVRGFQTLPQIKPGDIVQFRHVRIEGFNHEDLKRRYWLIVEHHTAVVVSVDAGPAVMKVCHQNWGPKKEVRQDTLYLADLVQGWLRIYRPQAKPPPAGG